VLCAVIPVQNEGARIGRVLDTILTLPVDLVLPVVNGSRDDSRRIVESYPADRISLIHFEEPLGLDVPRAVGALAAYRREAEVVLFVDGDMEGEIGTVLEKLVAATKSGVDLSLTDCYPPGQENELTPLVAQLLGIRRLLNQALGLAHLGSASLSHGPHAVSRRFLERVPFRELAVPPVAHVLAARQALRIEVAAAVPHYALGSPDRGPRHAQLIAETIIGDHLEAFCVLNNEKRSRNLLGVTFSGYNHHRRWDLLQKCWSSKPPDRLGS
jgi:glycosyltransferase involved in cell wall biosynthesis